MFDLSELAQKITETHSAMASLPDAPVRTPLTHSEYLSTLTGASVYLKHEQFQRTGAFKYRGAFTKINMLTPEQKTAGVVAASSGNHGLAVTKTASLSRTEATIFVPAHTSALKREKISQLGATLHLVDGDCLMAETQARHYALETGRTFISPYNDLTVLMGQGGIGADLVDQLDGFDAVLISVGGGGLIGGIGAFLKGSEATQQTEIVGCWPENSPIMHACLKAGAVYDVPETETLADATAGNLEKDTLTFALCQSVIDTQFLVAEAEIAAAMRVALEHEGVMIEGAAAVPLAVLIKYKDHFAGKRVVVLFCGRNISYDVFLEVVS